MFKDPLTVWSGRFPYDALAPAGITPDSPQDEVEDASFTLMTMGLMNPATQQAWHELRDLRRRMLVDFLLYDTDSELRREGEKMGAEPGEPPDVAAAALTLAADELGELADELPEITLDPPEPLEIPREFGAFPAPELIDGLIRFDR
jgi:hypothetical protein